MNSAERYQYLLQQHVEGTPGKLNENISQELREMDKNITNRVNRKLKKQGETTEEIPEVEVIFHPNPDNFS